MYSGSERPTHRESPGSVFRQRETDPQRVSRVCIQAAREINTQRISRVCIQAARDRPTESLKGLYSGSEKTDPQRV